MKITLRQGSEMALPFLLILSTINHQNIIDDRMLD